MAEEKSNESACSKEDAVLLFTQVATKFKMSRPVLEFNLAQDSLRACLIHLESVEGQNFVDEYVFSIIELMLSCQER